MTWGQVVLLLAAGASAGAVNAVAGGGSLLSFPALLLVLHHPLAANVTNTVGLLPGYVAGTAAYRAELTGQGARLRRLGPAAAAGAVGGCALLLATPAGWFGAAAPVLVLLACALLAAQPRLTTLLGQGGHRSRPLPLLLAVLAAGAYAAYFGAAVGVLLLALLGVLLPDGLQRLNALKNALSLLAGAVGAAGFLLLGPVDAPSAFLLAGSSLVGGRYGAGAARRLPERALRRTVLVVGTGAALLLLLR